MEESVKMVILPEIAILLTNLNAEDYWYVEAHDHLTVRKTSGTTPCWCDLQIPEPSILGGNRSPPPRVEMNLTPQNSIHGMGPVPTFYLKFEIHQFKRNKSPFSECTNQLSM